MELLLFTLSANVNKADSNYASFSYVSELEIQLLWLAPERDRKQTRQIKSFRKVQTKCEPPLPPPPFSHLCTDYISKKLRVGIDSRYSNLNTSTMPDRTVSITSYLFPPWRAYFLLVQHSDVVIVIDGQVHLVRLQTDSFRLFLRQQTDRWGEQTVN